MSDLQVLVAVRGHLLNEDVASRVHLTLPPKAIYPLVLVELEELWSNTRAEKKGAGQKQSPSRILGRVKFKVSAYSQTPGMEEITPISHGIRRVLEGAKLWLPEGRTAMVRFLSCQAESLLDPVKPRAIYHFFDALVRG